MLVRELEVRYGRVVAECDGTSIVTVTAASAILRAFIGDCAEERFVALLLDSKLRALSVAEIARGGIDSCAVDAAILCRTALLSGASRVLVAHNHPGGEAHPSEDDRVLTEKVRLALRTIGLKFVDHLILGHSNTWSEVQKGMV